MRKSKIRTGPPCFTGLLLEAERRSSRPARLRRPEASLGEILRGAAGRIEPRRDPKRAADRSKQQPLRTRIRAAQTHRPGWQRHQLPVLCLRRLPDIFHDPLPDRRRIFAERPLLRIGKACDQASAPAGQRLRPDAWADDIAHCKRILRRNIHTAFQRLVQHLRAHVAHILLAQRPQQRKLRLYRIDRVLQKFRDLFKISTASPQEFFRLRAIAALSGNFPRPRRIERRFRPEAALFICRRQLLCRTRLLRGRWRFPCRHPLLWSADLKVRPAPGGCLRLRQRQLQRLLCGGTQPLAAKSVFPRLYDQIAIAAAKPRRPGVVRPNDRRRKHLRFIENSECDLRSGGEPPIRLPHLRREHPHRRIARGLIEKRDRAVHGDDLFICRGRSEAAAVYQQRAAGRAGKPAAVQRFLRLTRTEKMPCAVAEHLDPRMIVVAVRPARRIDLPGRKTGCAQRIDGKCGFLAAPPKAGAPRIQRADRPVVGRAVADLLRVPIVDRQRCFTRGKPLHAIPQLRIKEAPAVAKRLLVYARMEHIIEKQRLRQRLCERRMLPQEKPMLGAGPEQCKIIVCPVAERACGIAPPRQQRTVR